MASVILLKKKQHVFLSHAPRVLISALYLVQQCHCKQQLSSTALKAGGSSAAAEQRMLKQQGCSTGCWATVQAQHSLHVVLQILPLLSDLGFLIRTDKISLGRYLLLNKMWSGGPVPLWWCHHGQGEGKPLLLSPGWEQRAKLSCSLYYTANQ